jgi:two-component system cell cycle sensor histidine kinase/response regulator CckA
VDDEEGVRLTMTFMLELLGFEVLVAETGDEALVMERDGALDFQLVISDYMMPGLDGVETLRSLQGSHPEAKGILCSGHSPAECLKGRTLQNCIYLGKPFGLKELEAAVDLALG